MSKFVYRCENEYGSDPCEAAQSNRKFSEDEIVQSLDGGPPKCPGKTRSGKPCSEALVPIKVSGGGLNLPPWWKIAAYATGGVVVILLILWMIIPGPASKLQVVPDPVIFPLAKGGVATASLSIRNDGEGKLVIKKIEVRPSAFSVPEGEVTVAPQDAGRISIRFESRSNEMTEGDLVLHSNAKGMPTTTVKLIANRDPWWVYRKLEPTSKIMVEGQ